MKCYVYERYLITPPQLLSPLRRIPSRIPMQMHKSIATINLVPLLELELQWIQSLRNKNKTSPKTAWVTKYVTLLGPFL
jgi:hypothetical protein